MIRFDLENSYVWIFGTFKLCWLHLEWSVFWSYSSPALQAWTFLGLRILRGPSKVFQIWLIGTPAFACLVSYEISRFTASWYLFSVQLMESYLHICSLVFSQTLFLRVPPSSWYPSSQIADLSSPVFWTVTSVWAPPPCPVVCKVYPGKKPVITRLTSSIYLPSGLSWAPCCSVSTIPLPVVSNMLFHFIIV